MMSRANGSQYLVRCAWKVGCRVARLPPRSTCRPPLSSCPRSTLRAACTAGCVLNRLSMACTWDMFRRCSPICPACTPRLLPSNPLPSGPLLVMRWWW